MPAEDDELDREPSSGPAPHRPQSLLLSFLGALVVDFPVPPLPSMVLLDLLADLGVSEAAARATLKRMAQRGLLTRGQVGRTGNAFQVNRWGLREWFTLTFVMGALFISGQVYEYAKLTMHDGLSLSSDPYGSIFYLATGFHGLHVTGGLLAFLLVLGRTFVARRFTHEQATSAIVVSYYWHFVDVVWIALFATLYIL